MSNGIKIDFSESPLDIMWDRFLSRLPGAHHEQTSMWAQFRRHYGWRPLRWVARTDGQILGGIQVLVRHLPYLGQIGYIVRGPMCGEGQADIEAVLVDRVTQYAFQHRFLYQVFDCPYSSATLGNILERRGYAPHPPGIPPSGLIKATILLDLEPEIGILLSNMRTTVKQNIKTAEKAGFEISLGQKEDLDTFWELMLAICRRRLTSPSPSHQDFFKKLWDVAGASGTVRLFLVRLGEEVVSAAFTFIFGNTIRVWKVGWSGAYQNKFPNHLMWWSIIRWAKDNNIKVLDFVWVDEHDAGLLVQGERRPQAFRDGTTFFKMGFGGNVVMIPEARAQFFHPALRSLAKLGGMRLLRSRFSQQLLRWFWSRLAG